MTDLRDAITDEFQYTVDDLSFRNRSILDQLTKYQDSCARVNRSIAKACTQCGCIQINGKKQPYPKDEDLSLEDVKALMDSHISGKLCEECRDMIEKDMGRNLFYLASLSNTLGLNMYDIMLKELDRIKLLGKFNLK